jgi:hypothetical protein
MTLDDLDEEAPRFTARHLRAGGDACSLRMHREIRQRKGGARNWGSSRAFDVERRLLTDIATAHSELCVPDRAAFPTPTDLSLEEQRVYRAAMIGYLTVFPEPFVVMPLGDEWESVDPELGYRWVGPVTLPGIDAEGRARVRLAAVTRRAIQLDDAAHALIALRTESFAERVYVDRAALIDADRLEPIVIDAEARDRARVFAVERAERLLTIDDDPRPRMGRDCLGCPYVAQCPVYR